MHTNLKEPFLTCREFLPAMIDGHDGWVDTDLADWIAATCPRGAVLMVDGGVTA